MSAEAWHPDYPEGYVPPNVERRPMGWKKYPVAATNEHGDLSSEDWARYVRLNNDGAKDRKEKGSGWYKWIVSNNFPGTLQLLCWNCNCGKHLNKGICPHKTV